MRTWKSHYVEGCEQGYTCDRLPGYATRQDMPSACLQAPASVVEKEIGRYCGRGYFCAQEQNEALCTTPAPCPDGLQCAPDLKSGLADAGNNCLPWEFCPCICLQPLES
jgi:hypothetical protein